MKGFPHVIPIEVRFRDLDTFRHNTRERISVTLPQVTTQPVWARQVAAKNGVGRPKTAPTCGRVSRSRITEIKRSSLRLEHRVEADGELAAEGYSILVHYDYAANRSLSISPEIRAKIEAFEQSKEVPRFTCTRHCVNHPSKIDSDA